MTSVDTRDKWIFVFGLIMFILGLVMGWLVWGVL